MRKSSSKKAKKADSIQPQHSLEPDAISEHKNGNIVLNIHAKPGSKTNNILGVSSEGIGVQISAPPHEGEANAELIKYLSKVLGVRKSDLKLEKGSKSRNKAVHLEKNTLTKEEVHKRIHEEIDKK